MRCGYCSWLGGSRAVLFKNTLRTPSTLARMPYRWASAHQKGCAASMLATSPVFRGFSINFFPMVTVFHAFLYGVVHGGPCGIARSTPDPYLNYQQSRSLLACRVPVHSDIHRVKAPLSRRGITGATYVCSKGEVRLI